MDYPRESGVVYKTIVDSMLKLKDSELQGKFAKALLQFTVYGEYDGEGEDDVLDALMEQPKFSIKNSAERYDAAVENGKKGGGKRRYTDAEVYQYYVVEGHSMQECVAHFGYTDRSIRLKSKKGAPVGVSEAEK